MWSIIDKKNFSKYISEHPKLEEDSTSFILHENNDKIFLPRFFYKNFPSKYIEVYNPQVNIEKINLTFGGEPRENQKPLMDKILGMYKNDNSINGIIKCPPGFGKAQPVDSKICTPNGWKKMGNIRPGDMIIGSDGLPTKVLNVYPQGYKKVYRVIFNDKTFTECTDEHLWNVRHKTTDNFRTLELNQIKSNIIVNNRCNWFIPMTRPVEFNKVKTKIDPYVLGVLIGDGCITDSPLQVTTKDDQILSACKKEAKRLNLELKKKTGSKYDYRFTRTSDKNLLINYIKHYNMFGNNALTKHVPQAYLYNDFNTRLKLFQGLMDTDGTVNPSGRVYFTTISKQLAEDVIFLTRSFGGRTSVYSRKSTYIFNGERKEGNLAYYVTISLPKEIEPFQLKRKLEIFRKTKRNNPSRGIKNIVYVGRKKCQCIQVENEDGLYVTDDFIVTHNTFSAIYLATKIGLKTLFIVDKDSLYNQWIREIVNFTKISPDDIGVIKKNIFYTENKPFTISTVQTLLSKIKKEPKEMYERMKRAGFGFVVYDEVHNTSASEQYAKSSVIMSSPNIIGLSATPFKFGPQEILMKNVIGELLYNEQQYQLKPEIYFHYYQSDLEKMRYMMMKLDFIASKAYYNKNIVNSSNYLSLFPKLVKQDLKDKHKIIIICWTKNQVEIISSKLAECGIKNTRFYGEKREFSTDDDVLVATFKFAGTGFDFKELSSLIYACPLSGKVSLIQTAGRVLRECQGKQNPKVTFLVDMTFPTYFLPEINRAKKIFQTEFAEVNMFDINE